MPLLTTFFFFILIGNLFEVVPGFSLSASSRIALPLTLAMISWFTYNGAGIRKHGFLGYLRHTCIIPSAPGWLRYTLLMFIEFVSNIIVRPITLTVRLWANFLAGHFLLAIFFLGHGLLPGERPEDLDPCGGVVPARGRAGRIRDLRRSHCKRSSSPSSAPPTSGRHLLRSTSQGGRQCWDCWDR